MRKLQRLNNFIFTGSSLLYWSLTVAMLTLSGCGSSAPVAATAQSKNDAPADPAPAAEPEAPGVAAAYQALKGMKVPVQRLEQNSLNVKGHVVRLQPRHITSEGKVDEAVFAALKDVPNLFMGVDGTSIKDEGMEQISHLEHLKSLSMISCQDVTDAGFAHMANFKEVAALYLNNTKITNEGMKSLRELKTLQDLNLFGTTITDEGLENLEGLDNLASLSLISCPDITNAGFKHLEKLTKLRTLWLINTKIGDEGIAFLSPQNPFEEVAFNNTKITAEGVSKFRKEFPGCVVVGK